MSSASEVDETLRAIIDAIPGHVFILGRNGRDYLSNLELDHLGLTREETLSQDLVRGTFHPDDVDRIATLRKQVFSDGKPFETEARIRGKDGRYRWSLFRINPLRNADGQVVQCYGTRTDIDDLKRAQEHLRLVIDTTPALIHSGRPDGYLDYFNKRWLEYLGVSHDAIIGWGWTNSIHPDDVDELVRQWKDAIASGEPLDCEARVRRADGEWRAMLHRKFPLRDESGNVERWFGSSIDIEDRKRDEDALRRQTAELQKLKDQLYKENLALKDEINEASMFEEIVGSSDALRRVLVQVSKVAPTESTVLITGETGTGKELLARAIHKRSDRGARAFVAVSCAAIAPSLVSSELFGYEKGAFTGALQRHLGRFELAEGGTIFLDEVGELPPETQIALLRVLQERRFERLGGTHSIPANVRVVAATNRDLEKAVADGSFRQDLYYRLNVFPLHMPPLRNRVEDISMLVEYFTQRYAVKVGKKIAKVEKTTLTLLKEYRWPGNVRELQNVIERAVILCDGDTLVVDETWLQQPASKESVVTRGLGRLSASEEKAMIESALAGARGRVSGPKGAAARLGVARSTLESRIRALRINKNTFKSP